MKKVKNVKLEEVTLEKLSKQAVFAGFGNVQNYMEHILLKHSHIPLEAITKEK